MMKTPSAIAKDYAQVEAEQSALDAHAFFDWQTELILAFGWEQWNAEQDDNPMRWN